MPPEGRIARAPSVPSVGFVIDGKYELVRLLGEGGMASVFEAQHLKLRQRVAIKILAPEFSRDEELVARFEREARAVALLKTQHAVRVTDVDVSASGWPYMVMEFLEGRDLDVELQARSRLPIDEAADYVIQACAAMVEAHGMGIIHRDLKPANLYLADQGATRIVKVLDFGISKLVGEATRLTGAGTVMGTVLYMPPEQVRASPNIDQRADLWSLGVILYELVAGRAPFLGSSPQIAAAIVSKPAPDLRTLIQVPDSFASIVMKTLERDPDRRVQSANELATQLVAFVRPTSVAAALVEQMSFRSSGTGTRAQRTLVHSKTVPMMLTSRPSLPMLEQTMALSRPTAPSAPRVLQEDLSSSRRQPPAPPMPPSLNAESHESRLRIVLAALVGLLAAVVVVALVYRRYAHAVRVMAAPSGDVAPRSP